MSSPTEPPFEVVEADLSRPEHQAAVLALVDAYSQDPMGDGHPLTAEVRERLIPGLREHPTALILLGYAGAEAVGIAVCFRGFSTFMARPLLNVHDFAILPAFRGRGLGRRLMAAVDEAARALGCGKLTLEVLENNRPARGLYEGVGFRQSVYCAEAGGALFMTKSL